MKSLIFDSGAIITLALNDLLYILEPLKKLFRGDFYITEAVKEELIKNPLKIKRFMLEALMIKKLLEEGILKVFPNNSNLEEEEKRILNLANTTFTTDGEFIKVLDKGETSCLALYNLIKSDALAIDERSLRMLCEMPKNLHKLFESKFHRKVIANEENYLFFKNFKVIRSSELVFIAYKNKIINLPTGKSEAIEALFYAAKFKGCAISRNEIETAKRLI